jgi:glycosyltransferase involved in cell wall biosynthesis
MIRATVAICTRNRSSALVASCEAVLAQRADFPWELVIVDNGSDDDTPAVARALVGRHPGRARLVEEPTLGLSAARNAAVRVARGDWLGFVDDDAVPAVGWLEAYEAAFASPEVFAAGGPIDPEFRGARPVWLDESFLVYLSAWDLGAERQALVYNNHPRGTNMALRRAAFDRAGTFDPRLGRRGRSLRSCEEIELTLRLERLGHTVLYEPAARVRHRVELSRMSPDWMAGRFRAQAFSEAIVDWKHFGPHGLSAGVARHRAAAAAPVPATPGGEVLARCRLAAWRAYRRGALYAAWAVSRWRPDDAA